MCKRVSAIITTYKRPASVIEKALNSIEAQTYPVFEIIVVDDNPFDTEGKKLSVSVKKLCENRATYIKQLKGNAGANAARNLGIEKSNGEFVAFLDDDDIWLSTKIEKQIASFDDDIGMVFCSGICHEIHSDGTVRELNYFNYDCFKSNPNHIDLLRFDYIGSTSHPLIRKSVFKKCGLFDESMPARQDYDMWIRITKAFRVVGIKEKLFIHTLHENGQISKNKQKSYLGYIDKQICIKCYLCLEACPLKHQ